MTTTSTHRRIKRHLIAGLLFALAIISGFIPVLQGWIFTVIAILILAVEYRWIRYSILRPIFRRYPERYRKMIHWRRALRAKLRARFSRGKNNNNAKATKPPSASPVSEPPESKG